MTARSWDRGGGSGIDKEPKDTVEGADLYSGDSAPSDLVYRKAGDRNLFGGTGGAGESGDAAGFGDDT